jgi:hypothetical protein
MAKGTIFLLFFLIVIAVFLFGLKLGRFLPLSSPVPTPTTFNVLPTTSPTPSPTILPSPTVACSVINEPCGVGFSSKSLGTCCYGFTCKLSRNPDQGGSCIVDTSKPKPTTNPSTSLRTSLQPTTKAGLSTFTDKTCGFSFSYPGGYLSSNTTNGQSTILTNPNNANESIVTACEAEIPKPPLTPDKLEEITIDGLPTFLYHDSSSKDGTPRDEIIVKHPTNGKEIIVAGYGQAFNATIASFKFIK